MGDDWTLTATDTVGYYPPSLGNGHTGVVMDISGMRPAKMFQASVFDNGRPGQVSSIRQVFVPLSLNIIVDGNEDFSDWKQSLHLDSAFVGTSYRCGGVRVEVAYKALRQMPHVVMAELSLAAESDADVTVVNIPVAPETLTDVSISPATIWCEDGGMKLTRMSGRYDGGRQWLAAAAMMIPGTGDWMRQGADTLILQMKKGERATMWAVASQCSTTDFADPFNEADRQTIYAVRQGESALNAAHFSAWKNLWRSRIEIEYNNDAKESDRQLSPLVNSALYNLYSSVREGSRRSIAPMGLTSDKYYGHVFWDADTWILPVLAVLNPELARSMVDYRVDGLDAARRRAAAYGYEGAMYPWEADQNGEESTPTFALTGPLEHHITADVARGAWIYYCVTGDSAWLRNEGYPLLKECADFWISRVEPLAEGGYSIRNVVGADEYAIGVDDNAFTNGAARRSLEYAADAAEILGLSPDPRWRQVARGIVFHQTPGGIIREHAEYNGEMTKQADVELLAYPLNILTDHDQIKRNIEFYSTKIDSVGGPAMSHAAMAVNYLRMGEPEKAVRLIDRAVMPYLRGPFLSLSETPGNNDTYFMTAAGGLLQAIVFGYCGVEIDADGIRRVETSLPATIRRITLHTVR